MILLGEKKPNYCYFPKDVLGSRKTHTDPVTFMLKICAKPWIELGDSLMTLAQGRALSLPPALVAAFLQETSQPQSASQEKSYSQEDRLSVYLEKSSVPTLKG